MSSTNDSGASAQSTFRLENDVWSFLCGFKGLDGYVPQTDFTSRLTDLKIERIVNSSFEIVTRLDKEHFAEIVKYGSFADLTVCITDFCKVNKFQKISLLAIGMLRGVIPMMLSSPECALNTPKSAATDDAMIKFWFPVLFSFYDIIMNGEDLEVRRL